FSRDWSSDVCSSDLIAGDAAQVELLLNPGVSPHIYQLKPSDMAKMSRADAVVWIGPDMETFLGKVVMSIKPKRSLQLQHELSERSEERRVGKECRSG